MPSSKKQFYLHIGGKLVEVSEEVYQEYYLCERRDRYFMEDLKRERLSVDKDTGTTKSIPGREDSYERLLEMGRQFAIPGETMEDQVLRVVFLEKALKNFIAEERELIWELFYLERAERQVSEALHVAKNTMHRRREQVLSKLRGLLGEKM